MPEISIIVPVYKTEKYLCQCIDSLVNQTFTDLEIILVDDGSPDNGGAICEQYAKKDPRIHVIHKANGGLADARNAGLREAEGAYIGFVDSDDYVSPDMYECLLKACRNQCADISMSGRYNEDNNKLSTLFAFDSEQVWSREQAIERLLTWSGIDSSVCDKLFASHLFRTISFPTGKYNEDVFIMVTILQNSSKIVHIGMPKYFYRHRRDSITTEDFNDKKMDLLDAGYKVYTFVKDNYPKLEQKAKSYYLNGVIYLLCHICKKNLHRKYHHEYRILRRLLILNINFILKTPFYSCKVKLITVLLYVHVFHVFLPIVKHLSPAEISPLAKKLIPSSIKSLIRWLIYTRPTCISLKKQAQSMGTGIVLISTPTHGNLGDQAIVLAQHQLLNNAGMKDRIFEFTAEQYEEHKNLIEKYIDERAIILIDGGGNFGTLWIDVEYKMRDIVRRFPKNRIIVFPNTVFYSNDERGKRELSLSKEIFNAHPRLKICAREEKSYRFFLENYPNAQVYHMPDIALYIDRYCFPSQRKGIMLCFRNDHEAILKEEQHSQIEKILQSHNIQYSVGSTLVNEYINNRTREQEVLSKLYYFSTYEMVITDRLHAMVFCAITGTPCIAINNSSDKVIGVYEWIKYLPYITICTNLEGLISQIDLISNRGVPYQKSPDIKGCFSMLQRIFMEAIDGTGF